MIVLGVVKIHLHIVRVGFIFSIIVGALREEWYVMFTQVWWVSVS